MAKSKLAQAFKKATQEERKQAVEDRGAKKIPYLKIPDFPMFIPREDDNEIRIVPPLAADKHCSVLGFEVWVYFLLGRTWIAPNAFDQSLRNPLLEKYQQLKQVDEEKAQEFMGRRKTLLFVLDMLEKDENKILKLWEAGKTVIDSLIHLSKDRKTGELLPIEDPEQGKTIYFVREGKGLQTRYLNFQLGDKFPLDEGIVEALYTMEDLIEPMSVEQAEEIVRSIEDGSYTADSNSDDDSDSDIENQDREVRDIANEEDSSGDEEKDKDKVLSSLKQRIAARRNKK